MNPIYASYHYFPNTHFITIQHIFLALASAFRHPNPNFVRIFYLSHGRYVPRPLYPPPFDRLNIIWWRYNLWRSWSCSILHLLSLHPSLKQILSLAPCSQTLWKWVLFLTCETRFQTHTKQKFKLQLFLFPKCVKSASVFSLFLIHFG